MTYGKKGNKVILKDLQGSEVYANLLPIIHNSLILRMF